MLLKHMIAITLSFIVLGFGTLTVGQFALFLSSHSPLQLGHFSLFTYFGQTGSIWYKSVVNLFLSVLFGLQHSLQSHKSVKKIFSNHGYGIFERLLYNLGTFCTLQALMYLWLPIPSWVVWEISTSSHSLAWWIFSLVHCICWLIIYSGCCVMDPLELLGVQQVYHSIHGGPDPLSLKSEGLNRFYIHLRHPGFYAMSVILFVHPVMQIDRLLLAHAFVAYMILRTKVDDIDYAYQNRLWLQKKRDLHCLSSL